MLDISENLFQAVDEIVKRRLETVNYDTTIICTIDDNSNAANNEYTCSNGSAKFKAYSADTTFKKDESVLVMIPNNDYSQQKIIMGRYVIDDGLPYAHMNPFDNLIDASGNLAKDIIYDENKKYYSLLANENYPEDEEKDKEAREVAVWSKIFDPPLAQFDRLGVQGKFRSWLSALDPKYGSYGYRLEIKSIPERKVDEEPSEKTTNFVLDCSDMFGNPFNFQTFLKQEEVYDITTLGNILGMTLYFYQQPGSFRNEANELTPWQDDFNGTPMNKLDNLFTTEPYICLGYDLANFDKEQAILYTINNSTYVFNDKEEELEKESNKKTVNLRWIHEYDDGIKVVKNLDGVEGYTINWYRHYIGDPPADQYSGVYWRKVKTNDPKDKNNKDIYDPNHIFEYTFDPRVDASTEQIKVIIIPPEGKDVITSNILIFTNEDEVINNITVDTTNALSIVCQDGSAGNYFIYGQNNNMLDQSQATQVRRLAAYFNPSSNLSDAMPSILTEASEITWEFYLDNTMISVGGFDYNYRKKITDHFDYDNKTCEIIFMELDENGNQVERKYDYYSLITYKEEDYDSVKKKLKRYDFDIVGVSGIDSNGSLFKLNSANNDIFKIYKKREDGIEREVISITRYRYENPPENAPDDWTAKNSNDYTINPYQDYTVKLTYNSSDQNNDIFCSIRKNNNPYHAGRTLQFGIMGTNGTDTTVVITLDPIQIALTDNKTVDMFELTANIYDYNHQRVDFKNITNEHIKINWEWAWKDFNLESEEQMNPQKIDIIQKISYNDEGEEELDNSILMNICYLNLKDEELLDINRNHFLIIKATVSNWGNYPLIAYKAIPIRKSEDYMMLVGPTEVVYGPTGYADYYKDSYRLKNRNYETIDCDWNIYDPLNNNSDDNDIGNINNGILKPATMYFKGSKPYGVVALSENNQRLWIQPLVIVQNAYPSGMLNEWDGKSIVLNEDEGQFLAPVIAAGRKNSNNTFSGVMLGDFAKSESNNAITSGGTGLYGFDAGQLSFGFMEDGTAFIGKAGKGQILFDGTDSIIQSSNWKTLNTGMFMDLDDGILKMHNTDGYIFIDATDPVFPLSIGEDGSSSSARNFRVKWDGSLYATGAEIKGDIYADYIEANDGIIGGWQLSSQGFTSIKNSKIFLLSDTGENSTITLQIGDKFSVESDGTIKALDGVIGGWTIDKYSMKSNDNTYGGIEIWSAYPNDDNYRIKIGSVFGIYKDGSIKIQNTKIDDAGINFHEGKGLIWAGSTGDMNIQCDSELTLVNNTMIITTTGLKIRCSQDNVTIDGHKIYAYFA